MATCLLSPRKTSSAQLASLQKGLETALGEIRTIAKRCQAEDIVSSHADLPDLMKKSGDALETVKGHISLFGILVQYFYTAGPPGQGPELIVDADRGRCRSSMNPRSLCGLIDNVHNRHPRSASTV